VRERLNRNLENKAPPARLLLSKATHPKLSSSKCNDSGASLILKVGREGVEKAPARLRLNTRRASNSRQVLGPFRKPPRLEHSWLCEMPRIFTCSRLLQCELFVPLSHAWVGGPDMILVSLAKVALTVPFLQGSKILVVEAQAWTLAAAEATLSMPDGVSQDSLVKT
jgi:hypothetical protein